MYTRYEQQNRIEQNNYQGRIQKLLECASGGGLKELYMYTKKR